MKEILLDLLRRYTSRKFIAAAEMDDAVKAYEHARQVYRKILSETEVD